MCATFSADDIDKRVENANGDVIGTVTELEDDAAIVEPRSGVMDSIRAALGWDRAHGETVRIGEDSVDSIGDDVIRLESDPETPVGGERADDDAETLDRERTEERRQIGAERTVDRDDASDGIGSPERTDETERDTPADPIEGSGGSAERHLTDDTGADDDTGNTDRPGGAGETDVPHEPHPTTDVEGAGVGTESDDSSSADDPIAADSSGASGESATDDSSEIDDRAAFEAPSAADERVDTDARDGVDETATLDATASADESDASPLDDTMGTDAADRGSDIDDSADSGGRSDTTESSRIDGSAEPVPGTAADDDGSGVPDEAASTVDMADERGVADGAPSTETARETADETETTVSETGTEPGSAGETDAVDEFDRYGEADPLEAVSDGLDDADDDRDSAEATDPADRLDTGVDIESASNPGETETEADAATTEEPDLADRLDRGSGIEAVAADDGSATTEEAAGSSPSADRDLSDELDRGPDLESVATADREHGAAIDPDAIRGQDSDTGGDPETADRRIVTDDGVRVDRRPAETAGDHDRTAMETLERRPEAGSKAETPSEAVDDRRRTPSQLSAMADAQRAALEPSRRAVESGVAVQREVLRAGITGTIALQRQQLQFAESVVTAPVKLAAAMMGTGTGGPRDADAEQRRLELVDGLDTMYRKRLVAAGITSLDDLARADGQTVAEAAGVTEKRAASWIEQVTV